MITHVSLKWCAGGEIRKYLENQLNLAGRIYGLTDSGKPLTYQSVVDKRGKLGT